MTAWKGSPMSTDVPQAATDAAATWTFTRAQLIDAIANIELRDIPVTGPMAGKVLADDMADAILGQFPAGDASRRVSIVMAHDEEDQEYPVAAFASPEAANAFSGTRDDVVVIHNLAIRERP